MTRTDSPQTRTVSDFAGVLDSNPGLRREAIDALKQVPPAVSAKQSYDTADIAGGNVWRGARYNVKLQNILTRMGCDWRNSESAAIAATTALMALFIRS